MHPLISFPLIRAKMKALQTRQPRFTDHEHSILSLIEPFPLFLMKSLHSEEKDNTKVTPGTQSIVCG